MRLALPYANFSVTAMVLSEDHLYWNLEAARWAMSATRGVLIGYQHHPTVIAWQNWQLALGLLHDVHVREYLRRGHSYAHPSQVMELGEDVPPLPGYQPPPWLGKFKYHAEERMVLMQRDPEHYSQWGWTEEPGRV